MALKPLSPTNDFVFKKVFGENMTVLADFLKSVLDLPAEEYHGLTVVDPSLDREFAEDKQGILDIKINTSAGKVLAVELEVKPQDFIWQRILFYISKMVAEQVKSGYEYTSINRAIIILIADFVMVKGNKDYHNRYLFRNDHMECFQDSSEIHILELPKLPEADETHLSNWLRFLRAKTEEDYMSVSETNPAIKEAWGVIKVLSGDERARALAEAREKARLDLDSMLGEARRKGIIEVARNLLREKTPVEVIAKATGMTLEEVRRCAADLS
jgi:predicted transposase/invertase (TIGR01784 family)